MYLNRMGSIRKRIKIPIFSEIFEDKIRILEKKFLAWFINVKKELKKLSTEL